MVPHDRHGVVRAVHLCVHHVVGVPKQGGTRGVTKAPAFQFYTGDWRKDAEVQSLDHEHKGIWIDLIVIMWDTAERGRLVLRDGSPMPDVAIARNLGIPEAEWKQKRSTILASGTASEDDAGVFYCRRMVRVEGDRLQKVEAGRAGGLVKQNASTSEADTLANGGSTARKMKNEVEVEVEVEVEKDAFEEFWKAYPKRSGANPKKPALGRWRSNRKRGVAAADMIAGAERYNAFLEATKKAGTEYVLQAVTFLGQHESWAEDWLVTESDIAKTEEVHPSVQFNRDWEARTEGESADSEPSQVGGLVENMLKRVKAMRGDSDARP